MSSKSTEIGENSGDHPNTTTEDMEIFPAIAHQHMFDPQEYLQSFYKEVESDRAMQIVLFFLPGIIYYLPESVESVLDLGAGPTIYVPLIFRKKAKNVYTSDFSAENLLFLENWLWNRSNFDWSGVKKWIIDIENSHLSGMLSLEDEARAKVRSILKVNVFDEDLVQSVHCSVENEFEISPTNFDVIVTIFCLEYASENDDEYQCAVRNTVEHIKPGGYLIQGGVFHAVDYHFGRRKFRCYYLTKEMLLRSLQENNMSVKNGRDFRLIECDEIFLLISRKTV